MKVLIIGAKGMLGQDLAKVFADQELTLWDKDDLDITQADQVKTKITALKPDLIINSAAYNGVDDCEKNFDFAQKINGDGPKNLASIAKELGAIFVQYSTDYVFDGTKKDGYAETDEPSPISKYAESKLAGEKSALENCPTCYMIRTSRLFGAPASTPGAKKSFVDVMRQLSQDKNEFNLVDEEISCPTYTPDLAKKTREIVDKKLAFGIYHVTNAGGCSWFDFGAEVFKLLGKQVKLTRVGADAFPRPAKRPAYSVLINTKLEPLRTWQEALAEYLK